MLLKGEKDQEKLTAKQIEGLQELFASKTWMVFLPKSQSISAPSWMTGGMDLLIKHTGISAYVFRYFNV